MGNNIKTKQNETVLKICVLGEGGVGKTTLTQRLVTGRFNPATKMTIGIGLQSFKTKIQDPITPETAPEIPILAEIWDFGGEQRFRFLLPQYCQGSVGGLLIYDLTHYSTTLAFSEWIEIWRNNATPNAPLFLIGAKGDLIPPDQLPSAEKELKKLADELNIPNYFIISSKTGENVSVMINQFLKISYLFDIHLETHYQE